MHVLQDAPESDNSANEHLPAHTPTPPLLQLISHQPCDEICVSVAQTRFQTLPVGFPPSVRTPHPRVPSEFEGTFLATPRLMASLSFGSSFFSPAKDHWSACSTTSEY